MALFTSRCHALQLVAAAAWLLLLLAVVPPLPVHSAACLKPCYPGNNTQVKLPQGLTKNMFSPFACLADPSVDCRLPEDFADKQPGNSWTKNASCPSCFLYFRHCSQADGSMNSLPLKFVSNSASPVSLKEHALVMPSMPCRGVEVWEDQFCGGEEIWEAAFNHYNAKGDATKYFSYVFAVNSMRRRGMNQLHMHVGLSAAEVAGALQAGYKWAVANKTATFFIKCTNPTKTTIDCKFNNTAQKPADNRRSIKATIAAGATVKAVKPFNTVYGPNPAQGSSPSDATIFNSMADSNNAPGRRLMM
ncbi:hypothetical protein OEZ85_009316 [Tetradesmus obliquus]|uniref:Uncharacterized protein n=1 Tax=Tetradesmus obliquus TaxID=3088 RepID=A0ABY8U8W4_TETOB|nr:hypothetical protein OEZ85_009316 [Tetradesmus obliquus]